ncbi:DUF4743 domain-containing protein [Aquincola tertiaricarbonis]|uniref:DUF4743 domain-containing protein n=1 Tax=Aquincola tertiaricarbonis TaxID=391953 RepID=A0ABY4SBD6_AQUTE|nr:DUF4743 domain-containing protein [Aquincola tertiaricarbonis]URI09910.1 DUF4743 domain-containing protein [Aquincola tertiaricarbonis]
MLPTDRSLPWPAPAADWPCIRQARHCGHARRRFRLRGQAVGSVAEHQLPLLQTLAPDLQVTPDHLSAPWLADGAAATAWFEPLNLRLRAAGAIPGWRDERFPVLPLQASTGAPPLADIERAAARFWGTLTFGAHANGYLADAGGRPTHLWLGRRSLTKAIDPGLLDNLIGGGVPLGQTPFETLVREGWEEAGLATPQLHVARPGRVIQLQRELPEGLQVERLHVFDIELPPGLTPANQDGEVSAYHCVPVEQALALAQAGEMTVDAALVTLDFALRHQLLPAAQAAALAQATAGLWWEPAGIQSI